MEIEIRNYSKTIGNETVLHQINMKAYGGYIYGIKGSNGSGKTMLLRAISGLIHPTEGEIIIDGRILSKEMSFPDSLGILLENPSFIRNYSAIENLENLASIQRRIEKSDIVHALERIGLQDAIHKKYKKFSLGMKQKLGIVAAIMEHPDLILLDEPTNALDEKSMELLKQILKEEKTRGALIMIASHEETFLDQVSDTIYQMKDGKLYE